MPNVLNGLGLQVQSRDELVAYFTAQYQAIYGNDINLESNTPDGQMMNIYIQAILDVQDLIVQVYNSFDPDNAVGEVLDQRVTINGIQRQPGTYTLTPVTIINSASVNLYGLDGATAISVGSAAPVRVDGNDIYTVSDNAGNRWFLQETQLGLAIGTHSLSFRAAVPGAQLTVPNTINVPITIVLGVSSVNNPLTYSSLGDNEENDGALRLRRQQSVSLASQGYLRGLLAALENVTGLTSAFVYENTEDTVDVDGVPGHSIWVIVAGDGADADIAQAIYTKRNAGCGMKGDVTYTIIQVDGSPFTIRWDEVAVRNLFIKFTVTPIDGTTQVGVQLIRDGIAAEFVPGVNENVNINQIATIAQTIDPNALVTSAGLSQGLAQTLTLSGTPASGVFKLNYGGELSAAINWNDAIGVIQTKLQGITGLSAATVTGSLASHTLVFNMTAVGNVNALLFVQDNTLMTSGPVAITFAYDADYQNTLAPSSKQNQFVVVAQNIIITPVSLLPATGAVAPVNTVQFVAAGGYGAYTYVISINNSGASIDASTGLYTAGVTPSTDTVRVTDAMGNTKTATVTVA